VNSNDIVFKVKDEKDFETRVVAASSDHVVVVDFWAEWCAPCLFLGPVLEKVIHGFAGKARLAKVDVQENQDLAERWQIRGIPAIKVFRHRKVVKDLVGALPESELRRELSEVIPSEADECVAEGERLEEEGNLEEAEAHYRKALDMQPAHPWATTGLARIAMGRGDLDAAKDLAQAVAQSSGEPEAAAGILTMLAFREGCKEAGGRQAIEERLGEEPDNLDLMFGLGCCLARQENYPAALEEFLGVIEREKHYREDAAKKAMVGIFAIVGHRSELASKYRERLSRVLYS
jgi:putative thioredoxin